MNFATDFSNSASPHFFISRAGPDGPFAVKIANILVAAGYRVFIQDRDIFNESIIAAMHRALTSGARTIALLSTDYLDPERQHCAAEWQATIADDPLNAKRRLIVLRVGVCAPTGLLKALAYWDLVGVGGDEQLLADIVARVVDPMAGTALPEAIANYWRDAQTLVHPEVRPTSNFIDHDCALDRIDQGLWHGEVRDNRTSRPVAIRGMGGVGKSTLAREFAWQASQASNGYAGIWWLGAGRDHATGDYAGVESALIDLRATLYPRLAQPRERALAARGMLDHIAHGGHAKPWLLIYDNVDDLAVLKAWPPPLNAHVLLTTRLTTFRKGEVELVSIDEWPLPDCVHYLLHESGRNDFTTGDAEAIAQAVGRLPLAMSHAAAYLREVPTASPAGYLAAIGRRMRSAPPGFDDVKPVYATFQEAIEHAEAQANGARAVMTFAALLAPGNIPLELYQQDASYYPPELAAVVADPDGIETATGALARLSLIAFNRSASTFSLHRLVHAATADLLPPAGKNAVLVSAIKVMKAAHPGYAHRAWPLYERLLPHARVLTVNSGDDLQAPLAEVLDDIGQYLYGRGAYAEAETFYKRACCIQAGFAGHLAVNYEAQGKFELAEPLYVRDLAQLEAQFGLNHPCLSVVLGNLAGLYIGQDRLDLAEPLLIRSLAILKNEPGDELSATEILNKLGVLYEKQERYDVAQQMFTRVLALRETELESNPLDLAVPINNLAFVSEHVGDLDSAEALYKKSISMLEAAYGPKHPQLEPQLQNLALFYDRQGKYELGLPWLTRCLELRDTVFGPSESMTIAIRRSLALSHDAMGNYDAALPIYRHLLAICTDTLGPDEPETIWVCTRLAQVSCNTELYEDAEALTLRAAAALERAKNRDHPDIIEAIKAIRNLKEVLREQPDSVQGNSEQ